MTATERLTLLAQYVNPELDAARELLRNMSYTQILAEMKVEGVYTQDGLAAKIGKRRGLARARAAHPELF